MPNSWYHFFYKDAHICSHCFGEFNPTFERFSVDGIKGLAIYPYDETIRDKLYRVKGCHDIELASVFLDYYNLELAAIYRGFIIVPAPSWHEDDEKREFNHVVMIFRNIPLKMQRALIKTSKVKQADLKYSDRQNIGQHIGLIDKDKIIGQNILLVDDVMTTGATIKACVKLLKDGGAKQIKILVMSRTAAKP